MYSETELNTLKNGYIDCMKSYGRIDASQEARLNALKFHVAPQQGGYSGLYDAKINTIIINSNYPMGEVINQTIFHELDHARTTFVTVDGELSTGLWSGKKTTAFTKIPGALAIVANQGEMLSEGVTTINGETVYRSITGTLANWKEEWQPIDGIPGTKHKVPSGLWYYKLNGNFISQIGTVLGLSDEEMCRIVDKNEAGRQELTRRFEELTGDKDYFQNLEFSMDYVATVAKYLLIDKPINNETIKECSDKIETAQLEIYGVLPKAYARNMISPLEFEKRARSVAARATLPELESAMVEHSDNVLRATRTTTPPRRR